jgi:hypothetical protein
MLKLGIFELTAEMLKIVLSMSSCMLVWLNEVELNVQLEWEHENAQGVLQ